MTLPRWLAPVVTALVAAVAVLSLTPDGAGLSNDSVTYLGAATNLADGEGLTSPFTNPLDPVSPGEAAATDGHIPLVLWPPAYPALLAATDVGGSSPQDAGHLLNALAIAITAATTSVLARRLADGAEAAAWLAPLLALAAAPVLQLHRFLLSEPTALAVNAATLLALAAALEHPTRRRLAAVALLGALAPLVRVTGVAVPLVAALALGWWGGGDRRARLRFAGVAASGLVPVVAWALWSRTRTDAAVVPVAWHPPPGIRFEEAIARGIEWLVPAAAPTVVRAAILSGIAAVVLGGLLASLAVRRTATRPGSDRSAPDDGEQRPAIGAAGRAAIATAGFVVVHIVVVVASATFLQEELPIGGRLLVPVWPPTAALLVAAGARSLAQLRSTRPTLGKLAERVLVAGAVIVIALLAMDADEQLRGNELAWDLGPQTAVDHAVIDLPTSTVVITNAPAQVWTRTERPAVVVPRRWVDGAGAPNPRLAHETAELQQLVCAGAVVVLVDEVVFWTPYVATPDEVRSMLAGFELVEVAAAEGQVLLRPTANPTDTCGPTE